MKSDAEGLSDAELVTRAAEATENAPLETSLFTDQRVLARVTDGIYRQPASALRELISNAYDADASRVTIRTERPDFRRMSIDDDGNGMTLEALIRLLRHIGGSSKRTKYGVDFGVTSEHDPDLSPGGRKLIGKIGIGLFSVAQLTSSFHIATKARGKNYQAVASVILKQYSDEISVADDERYEAGRVQVWTEPADDIEAHGTSIVLTAIRPQTRETLQSAQRWASVFADPDETTRRPEPPKYHVGVIDRNRPEHLKAVEPQSYVAFPWTEHAEGKEAMRDMVDAAWNQLSLGEPNPSIAKLFDSYLQLVWTLSQAAPLPYVDIHPFEIKGGSNLRLYRVQWEPNRPAEELEFPEGRSVREAAGLGNAVRDAADFQVWVDEVSLSRPIKFLQLPNTRAALASPLLFVSSFEEQFSNFDKEMSGGPLAFQAYFFVAPKIAPVENRGVKIRVSDASGLAFDPSFMDFPVAERSRLTQIICEIFVTQGFDGALNIDRESFNYAHMHVRAVRRWLHVTLRKVLAEQKRLENASRQKKRIRQKEEAFERADEIVARVWDARADATGDEPPPISIVADGGPRKSDLGGYALSRHVVGTYSGANYAQREAVAVKLVTSMAQILSAYGLLDGLTTAARDELLMALREIAQELK
ncbi:ATP-binding protein [Micromonospora aurantiaca (nom. illeg.)]|uniref:ATP-binding protein n=1 Tax=Micromonospora aurantiaca (nom. illeg.) TaxID=47850 RepID=UPI003EC07319